MVRCPQIRSGGADGEVGIDGANQRDDIRSSRGSRGAGLPGRTKRETAHFPAAEGAGAILGNARLPLQRPCIQLRTRGLRCEDVVDRHTRIDLSPLELTRPLHTLAAEILVTTAVVFVVIVEVIAIVFTHG